MNPGGSENNAFERTWQEWLNRPDLKEEIARHLVSRRPFLDFVEQYSRQASSLYQDGTEVKVLEVGCGTAIDSCYLSQRCPAHFYAGDLSVTALRVARKTGEAAARVHFLATDLKCLSFPDGTFDVVFSQGVLEHFRDPDPILAEQVRVMRKGGVLIIDVPQTYNPYTLFKKIRMWQGRWPYGWETQYSVGSLKRLARRHGLVPAGVGSWGDTFGFDFRAKGRMLRVLDRLVAVYFKVLGRLAPSLTPYCRQCVSMSFVRADSSAKMQPTSQ